MKSPTSFLSNKLSYEVIHTSSAVTNWDQTLDFHASAKHTGEKCGIPIKLANTFKLKIISAMDVKTDKMDARKIADVLRTDTIPECYVVPFKTRDGRQVVRHRISLVQDRTAVINRTRSLLDKYDITLRVSSLYSKKALTMLSSTTLDGEHDNAMFEQCVRHIEYITQEISEMEKRRRKMTLQNEYAKILMGMTDIDYFGAMLLASEIHDIARFSTPEQLVSWA